MLLYSLPSSYDFYDELTDIKCYKCGRPGVKSPDCPCEEADLNNSDNNKPRGNSSRSVNKPAANVVDDIYLVCHTLFTESDSISAFHHIQTAGFWTADALPIFVETRRCFVPWILRELVN